jgi:hypothetical protein
MRDTRFAQYLGREASLRQDPDDRDPKYLGRGRFDGSVEAQVFLLVAIEAAV